MEKSDYKIGSNCTDVDCKFIVNSACYAGLCKCNIGYGPSNDRRACRKSKKIGQPCHPIVDTCFMEKLQCEELTNVCQCAPGYKYDSIKNDCVWVYYCEENLIYDSFRRQCVKPTENWFLTTNHNPKLSFITFVILVFCFIKVMRSNSPYSERRRRISANINRNSFDLLSTIVNYENNQRYPIRNGSRQNLRGNSRHHHLRRNNDEEQFCDNQPPPPYEEIIRSDDLKQVTVDQMTNGQLNSDDIGNRIVNGENGIELKELCIQDGHKDGQPDSQLNNNLNNNNIINSTNNVNQNQLNNDQSTSSSSDSLENGQNEINVVNNNNNSINNRNLINNVGNSENSDHRSHSLENGDIRSNVRQSTSNQSNQNNQSNEQLPTYEQAIMIGKKNSPDT